MDSAQPPQDSARLTVDNIIAPEPPTLEVGVGADALELEKVALENQALRDLIKLRGDWADKILYLMVAWLVIVVIFVTADGRDSSGFHVSDAVMIAFISTTTVNVLTLGYIVANHLFPKGKD